MNSENKLSHLLQVELQELQKKYNLLKAQYEQDLTERRLAEEALLQSQIGFRKVVEQAPIALAIISLQGKTEFINKKAVEVFGYKIEEISDLETWWNKAYPDPEYRRKVMSEWTEDVQRSISEETEFIGGDYRITCNNGTEKMISISGIPISDKIVILFEDITERKRIEENLFKSEQQYKLISEITSDYVFKLAIDPQGKINMDFVSANFKSITGRSINEASRVESWSGFIHPDDYPKLITLLQELMQRPHSAELECRSFVHNHRLRWISVICRSDWDEKEQRVTSIVGAIKDISERKQVELQIREKNEAIEKQNIIYLELNEELRRTNEKLKEAKERAEESDRLKTSFLQNMSHEIRTPMNAIMGFSSLLSDNYNNKAKLERFSEIINQRCNDLLEIINDILDISKIESGQLTLNIEECNLDELFAEIRSFFREYQKRIGKEHIVFSMQMLCDLPEHTILTDKVKLKQILINLIGNSFKFTRTGRIEGGCKLDNKNNLVFYVSDTGIGIPQDKHQAIFERFTQLADSRMQGSGGTGLGLSIVKGLVLLLDGKIWLESVPEDFSTTKAGETTFYFSFPVKYTKSSEHNTEIKTGREEYFFNDKTLLIVEDDIFNADYIKEILDGTGIHIIHTVSGREAVRIAADLKPDIILMDIRLPDIDGYEAARQIIQRNPASVIIAQTAYAAQEDRQKALNEGCMDYMSKPLNRGILLDLLKTRLH